MPKIKMMTDSASDITKEAEERYGIRILPFTVTVGDQSYLEREDFTPQEFYQILLDAPRIPTTAQITAYRFLEEFEQVWKDGYQTLIYVSINGTGSATNGNAHMAVREFYELHPEARDHFTIHVVDSKNYCVTYGYPVVEAAKKAERGSSVEEILAYLEDWFQSAVVYFAPYTLEFVKKSGRVPAAAAFVGELMGLRPIITIVDGETRVVEKVRGDNAVIPALLRHAKETMIPHTPYLMVKGMLEDKGEELAKLAEKEFGYRGEGPDFVGASIAINAGPKMVGIIVKGKNRSYDRD